MSIVAKAHAARLLVLLAIAFCPGIAVARWSTDFAPLVDVFIDGEIVCMTSFEGQPVLAGCFGRLGGRQVDRIAHWDGSAWQPFGRGLDTVYNVTVWRGRLVAAGGQLGVGGARIAGAAVWNGSDWSQLGEGLHAASKLVVWNDRLVAIGQYFGTATHDVCVLDDNQWHTMPAIPHNGRPFCLAVSGADLLVGTFEHGAFRWSGSEWQPAGLDSMGMVSTLCTTRQGLVAETRREDRSTGTRSSSLHLRSPGGAWSDLQIPGAATRTRLLGTWRNDPLFAMERRALAVWNDAGVDSIRLPFKAEVYCAHDDGERLWLVVSRRLSDGGEIRQVISYDGVSWSVPQAGAAPDEGVAVLLSDGDRLLAAGDFARFGDASVSSPASWDGRAWSPLDPERSRQQDSTACHANTWSSLIRWRGSLIGGGLFIDNHRPRGRAYCLARRDSTVWRAEGGVIGQCMAFGAPLEADARALAEGQAGLFVAGDFCRADDVELSGIGLWDGTTWRALGSEPGPGAGSFLPVGFSKLAAFRDGVVAVGAFHTDDGPREIGWWNGKSWDFMQAGTDGHVAALCVVDDEVVTGGRFYLAGHTPVRNVAAWDGKEWRSLGDGLSDPIEALGTFRGSVIAATSQAGGRTPLTSLWSFTGTEWIPFEGGATFEGSVEVLCEHKGDLWVGGEFGMVNDIPSANLARWIPE